MRPRLRKVWFRVHLYLGLVLGLMFTLLGLTGSILVFDHELDRWLNPGLLRAEGSGTGRDRPLAEIAAAATAAVPGLVGPQFLRTPRYPGAVAVVTFSDREAGRGKGPRRNTEVYVDPTTARVLGHRVWGEYLISWVYKLHYTLHLGRNGETAVGLAGLSLVASVATGLILWWPILRKGGVRPAFRVRRKHLNFDLHKVVGVASSLVLSVVAITGAYMIFPQWFKAALSVASAPTPFPEGVRSRPRTDAPGVDVDQAVRIARGVFPGAALKGIQLPTRPTDAYVVTFRRPGEVRRSWGSCQAWVDRHGGEVLEVRDGSRPTAADTFIAWQFPLHNGEAFGLAGSWAILVTGLTPLILSATGTLLWWRKLRSRARQQSRMARAVGLIPATAAG